MRYPGIPGTKLLHFWLSSRGIPNLLARARSLVQRFGFRTSKMESALTQWVNISHKFGVRASFPVTAIVVKRYPSVIKKFHPGEVEFALHGYTHIDYSSLNKEEQIAHLRQGIKIFNSTNIPFVGVRTPYTRWNNFTIEALKELKFSWDSSKTVMWDVIKSQKLQSQYKKAMALYNPMNASASPVLPELNNGLVEIPLCLPDDEMLVDRFGLSTQEIKKVWEAMLAQTYARGELFTLQLHPERIPLCKEAIKAVIKMAQKYDPKIWIASLDEIADWWRERSKFRAEVKEIGNNRYKILFDYSARGTILMKNIKTREAQREAELLIESELYPAIGVGNNCSNELIDFLTSEGYIVVKGKVCGIYFDGMTNFNKFELLERIENSGAPIIRFWRWPYGARSCLSITGDIDAITLVDFFMRLVGK